ncbi:MAG: S1C family serine protease [Haloarculaceae archaeon]
MDGNDHSTRNLYRETIPSVASIYVTADDHGRRRGAGSGFVYDAEHVVTNAHVVGDATTVDLRFAEGDWRTGRVVGTDAYTDLAVVAVADLPAYAAPLSLADEPPVPGAPVAALGNPMGLDGSITTGIVSGANRSMPVGSFAIPDTVQTDAPIDPGNSGGPLVRWADDVPAPDDDGTDGAGDEGRAPGVEVVGVNRARAGDNIGFAVSAAIVAAVVPSLIAEGRHRHPYLRARTLDVSPSVAEANGLEEPRGVLIVDAPDDPASGVAGCTGTRTVRGQELPVGGDVLVAVDGVPTDSGEALMRHLLLETAPGDAVELELLRDGRRLTERLTLAERPPPGEGDDPGTRRRGRRRRRRDGRGGTNIPVR